MKKKINIVGKLKTIDKKKLMLISGCTAGTLVAGVTVLLMTKPDEQGLTDPNNVGGEQTQDQQWDNGGFQDNTELPIPEEPDYQFDENSLTDNEDENGDKQSGEIESKPQVWYALYGRDDVDIDMNPKVTNAKGQVYSSILQNINKDYTNEQIRLQKEQNKVSQDKDSQNSQSNQNNQSGGVTVNPYPTPTPNTTPNTIPNTTPNTTPNTIPTPTPSPDYSVDTDNKGEEDVSVAIGDTQKFGIDRYLVDGVDFIDNQDVKQELEVLLNYLSGKVIIKIPKGYSTSEILKWITDEYKGKLSVDTVSYGNLDKSGEYMYIEIDYTYTKDQHNKLKAFADKKAKELSGKSEQQKIAEISKTINALGSYSKTGKKNVYSPYTLMNDGYGVCQAYTVLAKYMLDSAGIKNGIATGVSNGEAHSWNVYKSNGVLYHADFTFSDTQNSTKYLSLTDKDITKDRTVSKIIIE